MTIKTIPLVFALILLIFLPSQSETPTYSIAGQVLFTGKAPKLESRPVTIDEYACGHKNKKPIKFLVGKKGGLKNAVISVELPDKLKKLPTIDRPATMDQIKCDFAPHILLASAGQQIEIYNTDRILHSFHSYSKINKTINKAHPKSRKILKVKFDHPEIIQVTCDVHDWMGAWIVVTDHPYYAVSDSKGHFEIEKLPAGNFTLKIWHEILGEKTQNIQLPSAQAQELKIEFN